MAQRKKSLQGQRSPLEAHDQYTFRHPSHLIPPTPEGQRLDYVVIEDLNHCCFKLSENLNIVKYE